MIFKKLKGVIKIIVFTIGCAAPFIASAQKLPNIQKTGVWLPETVKIDGKLNEWGNGLSANNKANHLQYTLANDDKYLYLAVKSADKAAVGKIMAGGIALKIKLPGQKLNNPSIIYPYISSKYRTNTTNFLDSVTLKKVVNEIKELKVLNIKSISDNLISIYNDYGIKSALSYKNGELTYELLIPLTLIELNEKVKFNYTMVLDGTSEIKRINAQSSSVPAAPPGLPTSRSPSSSVGMLYEMGEATDFSGEYVLYKKQ